MRQTRLAAVLALALVNTLTLVAGVSVVFFLPGGGLAKPHLVERDPVGAQPVLRPSPAPEDAAVPGSTSSSLVAGSFRKATHATALGSRLSAMVVDPASGQTLFRSRAGQPVAPASTAKILTGTAALAALGPDARLATEVVWNPDTKTVTLVGGGDPTLASPKAQHAYPEPAQIKDLVQETAVALRKAGVTKIRLHYDTSLFSGPVTARSWKPGYVPNGYVAPVTALSVDSGRVEPVDPGTVHAGPTARVDDPPEAAATLFSSLLEDEGITVKGDVAEQPAGKGTKRLAVVHSPTVAALVEQMLTDSDNDIAEALGRHVALAVGKPPSFRGATAAVEQVLARLGVPVEAVRLYDCSGLSHRDRVTARALTRALALAASPEHPDLRSVLTGLPVAGYSGTLFERYGEAPAADAAGAVRAKTGTLTGVSTLAGVAYRPDGRILVFAFLADRVPPGGYAGAREALDEMAAALATERSHRHTVDR